MAQAEQTGKAAHTQKEVMRNITHKTIVDRIIP